MKISVFIAFTILIGIAAAQSPSQQPIIGIYTQDAEDFL